MRKGLKIDIFPSGIEYRFREIHYAKFPIPDNDYGEPYVEKNPLPKSLSFLP